MTADDVQTLRDDLHKHKTLLAAAEEEISSLREKVGHCATSVLETIMSGEQQEAEVKYLRARVAELETIIAQSEEQTHEAEAIFDAMRGAMGRMQETIKKVTETAKHSMAAAELSEQISELEEVAKIPDEEERIRPPFARGG